MTHPLSSKIFLYIKKKKQKKKSRENFPKTLLVAAELPMAMVFRERLSNLNSTHSVKREKERQESLERERERKWLSLFLTGMDVISRHSSI